MVSIGTTSPQELLGVILLTAVGISLVTMPVFLYTGDVSTTVSGVEESPVFLEVEDEVDDSLLGQPTLTIHIDAGAPVKKVSSRTVTGSALDAEQLQMTDTTVRIECERGRTCLIRATAFNGTVLDEITVTIHRVSYV